MRKALLAITLLAICPLLPAQQTLNNDNVIKATKAGFSEEFIIATINRSPGAYDISAVGLTALKNAGVTSKVVSAVVSKATVVTPTSVAESAPGPEAAPTAHASAIQSHTAARSAQSASKPRVFLESRSHSDLWNASRDQSMEMSKDFERDCPDVQISINQNLADYTVSLNHIEHGLLMRDNQLRIADKDGDLISGTKQGGSVKGDVKKACDLILVDWAKK